MKDTNNKEVRVIYDAQEVLSGLETPKLKDSEVLKTQCVCTSNNQTLCSNSDCVLCHVFLIVT